MRYDMKVLEQAFDIVQSHFFETCWLIKNYYSLIIKEKHISIVCKNKVKFKVENGLTNEVNLEQNDRFF